MILVISPAKKLNWHNKITTSKTSKAYFLAETDIIAQLIKKKTAKDLQKLMQLSVNLANLNYERFQNWASSLVEPEARQALLAFDGDVYAGLSSFSLNESQLTQAQKNIRILSGFYGLLRPLDLIMPHRLEMGTPLPNHRGKDLYSFWGDLITMRLNEELTKHKSKELVNLASNEYFKSINMSQMKYPVITPVFKDLKNGNYRVISFYAKKARGLMCRFMLDHKLTKASDLKAFNYAGYYFNANESNASKWIFLR